MVQDYSQRIEEGYIVRQKLSRLKLYRLIWVWGWGWGWGGPVKLYTHLLRFVKNTYFRIIFSILIVLVVMSTGYHIYLNRRADKQHNEPTSSSILISFSLLKNLTKLFQRNDKFASLDTIRLLMIFHVHLGHFYQFIGAFGLSAVRQQFSNVFSILYDDNSLVFARSPLAVDVLFTLSGFLLSFGLLRRLDRTNGRFNYPMFVFQRWIRFVVLYLGSIPFLFLLPLTGDGPIWKIWANKVMIGCYDPTMIIKNLLFISNFESFRSDKVIFNYINTVCPRRNYTTWIR